MKEYLETMRVEFDHFPVFFNINCAFYESIRTNTVTPGSSVTNMYAKFEEKLSDAFTERKFNKISDLLSADVDGGKIDTIASFFQNLFRYWCSNMKVSR